MLVAGTPQKILQAKLERDFLTKVPVLKISKHFKECTSQGTFPEAPSLLDPTMGQSGIGSERREQDTCACCYWEKHNHHDNIKLSTYHYGL